jgi:hypothetical protein
MQEQNYDQNIYPRARDELISLFNNIKDVKTLTDKCSIEIANFISTYRDNELTMSSIRTKID